jgi:hypothetical protein
MAALTPAVAAPAQPIGFVEASGATFIARDGKLIGVTQKTALFAGDRVVTRVQGAAKVNMASGCSVSVPQTSTLTVSADSCAVGATGFADRAGATMGRSNALDGTGTAVAVLAVAAAGAGLAAGLSGGGNGGVSP